MKYDLETLLPGIKKNICLAPYTTFRIGGSAKFFFIAKTKEKIINAVKIAKRLQIPFFILGGGSNLLVSDKGFDGLVIKVANHKLQIDNLDVFVEAGVSFPSLVREVAKKGLSGLEWAGGLPGTLGGAVRGNAGAFQGEIKDSIVKVECLDERMRVRTLSKQQCRFAYRSSIFKERNWIVLSAVLKLRIGDKKKIQATVREHINYRRERHPLEFPNAGSIFKNCDFKKIPPSLHEFVKPVVKTDPFPVVPSAFFIAKAGLIGLRQGDAQISEKHPNFIVNLGKAQAKDVLTLIAKIKKIIKKKFEIILEEEIQYLK